MPLPVMHLRNKQTIVKTVNAPNCHCEAPKGPWQSREGSHVDRTRHCRGADSRARRRTYSPYKPPSKWQTLPICHCEEAFRILPYSFFSLQDSFISVPRPYSELPGKAQKKLRSFDRSFMLALPIFPCSHPQSIVGANELNFCVRDGNRCTLTAINTNYLGTHPEN